MEITCCNLCSSSNATIVRVIERYGLKYSYHACTECELVYLNPRPTPIEVTEYYRTTYCYDNFLKNPVGQLHRARQNLTEIQMYKTPGKMLDIGCGFGFLVSVAQEGGWDAEGVETSERCRRYAREQFALHLHSGLPDCRHGAYDVVFLSHVLEHVDDPKAMLLGCRKLLAPEGVIVIKVPNFASLASRLAGHRWGWLAPPEHLYQFTPETLRKLAVSAGLCEVQCYTGGGDMAYFAPHVMSVFLRTIPDGGPLGRMKSALLAHVETMIPPQLNEAISKVLQFPREIMIWRKGLGEEITLIAMKQPIASCLPIALSEAHSGEFFKSDRI